MSTGSAEKRRTAPLETPSGLGSNAITDISAALTTLLADMFALYLKTKNFHWHVSGPHFRDYHLLLDEQAEQIFATTDDIAERARKIGGTTLRSDRPYRRACSASPTTMPTTSRRATCWPNCARTTGTSSGSCARPMRPVRRAQRRRHRQPAGELDRRGRAPHLVPVRDDPAGNRSRFAQRYGRRRAAVRLLKAIKERPTTTPMTWTGSAMSRRIRSIAIAADLIESTWWERRLPAFLP